MVLDALRSFFSGSNGFLGGQLQIPSSTNLGATRTSQSILSAFDSDPSRQVRYGRFWSYYFGNQYSDYQMDLRTKERSSIRSGRSDSSALDPLYKFTADFYNIVTQSVDLDVGAIFRFPTQYDAETDALQGSLDDILERSSFEERSSEITRYGATTGDVYLRVVDDWNLKNVKVLVYPPEVVRLIKSPYDRDVIDYAVVSYDYVDKEGGKAVYHNRTDVTYPNYVETYRDGELFDFDGQGETYPNRLGVVPFRQIQNISTGDESGHPTFHSVLPTIDKVNEVLSFLHSIIAMNADPPLVGYGLPQGALQKGSGVTPYTTTVWYIPSATDKTRVELLEWKGNLPDVMKMLDGIKDDVRDAMPEMHVTKMQQQGAYSGEALTAMMFAFISKITTARINYVAGVKWILRLAVAAQEMMDGDGSEIDVTNKRYRLAVNIPPVLPVDENALLNRVMSKLKAGLIGPDQALSELGYAKDQIPILLQSGTQYLDDLAARSVANAPTVGANQAQKGANNQPVNKQINSNKQPAGNPVSNGAKP